MIYDELGAILRGAFTFTNFIKGIFSKKTREKVRQDVFDWHKGEVKKTLLLVMEHIKQPSPYDSQAYVKEVEIKKHKKAMIKALEEMMG